MSRIGICAILTIILGFAGTLEAQYGQPQTSTAGGKKSRYTQGRAVFRDTHFDFGKVPQDSRVSRKFYLVNEGTDTLEIISIKPG